MALHVLNSDWLNQNANRNYPLADHASGYSIGREFCLPPAFFLDLTWPVHVALGLQVSQFYIRSIVSAGDVIIGTLGYWNSGSPLSIASFTVNVPNHRFGGVYALTGAGAYTDSIGQVILGNLEGVLAQGGRYEFDRAGAELAPLCVRPNLRGVSSLRVVRGADPGEPLYGDIRLVAGSNIRLTVDGNAVRVDAISGAGLEATPCDCSATLGAPIRSINGISPDAQGNFTFVGDDCFNIAPLQHGIRFEDKCSESCCGCEELTTVVAAVREAQQTVVNLRQAMDLLQERMATAMVNALASVTTTRGNCDG